LPKHPGSSGGALVRGPLSRGRVAAPPRGRGSTWPLPFPVWPSLRGSATGALRAHLGGLPPHFGGRGAACFPGLAKAHCSRRSVLLQRPHGGLDAGVELRRSAPTFPRSVRSSCSSPPEAAHANATMWIGALKREYDQDGQSLRILRSAQEKEDRRFQRRMDIQRRDIGTMTAAIDAMEHGDVQGVERAEAALESSVRKMRSQGSGFLVLIQEGLRASGLDCPYCAAQCVDACHAAGSPYVACLAECQGVGT
ncbi:unnamed protein product, partial [Prorocentrum cordatum]